MLLELVFYPWTEVGGALVSEGQYFFSNEMVYEMNSILKCRYEMK